MQQSNSSDERWGQVGNSRHYRVRHRTAYAYSEAVGASYGRAFLTPRELPWQRVHDHRLVIEPEAVDRSVGADVYGNTTSYFQVAKLHEKLVVVGESVLSVDSQPSDVFEAARQPWEGARPTASNGAGAAEFVLDLRPPEITDEVAAYAAESLTPGRALVDALTELTTRINHDFEYLSGSTTVATKVADVFAARAGVCQDFARIGAACLRSQGLAARYVSGYLATDPPPGRERMIGADATHAWCAVWVPDPETGSEYWLGFDPTNNQFADERYLTLAWGRDYADVPPLRGIVYADTAHSAITVSVDVAPIADPAPDQAAETV